MRRPEWRRRSAAGTFLSITQYGTWITAETAAKGDEDENPLNWQNTTVVAFSLCYRQHRQKAQYNNASITCTYFTLKRSKDMTAKTSNKLKSLLLILYFKFFDSTFFFFLNCQNQLIKCMRSLSLPKYYYYHHLHIIIIIYIITTLL